MPTKASLVVALTGAVAAGAVVLGQQPIFRAGTEIVQVDVSVLDDDRQPVRNLTAADFTVLEEGIERPVVSFTAVELPDVESESAESFGTDVATNEVGSQTGRLVIIMLDRSIQAGWPWTAAKRVATETVAQLGSNDLAAVVTWNGASQNLTADRALLLDTIARADPSGVISPEAQAIEDRVHRVEGQQMFSPLGDGRCMCGACGLDSIRRVAEAVADVQSRRKLLLFVGATLLVQDAPLDIAVQGCGFSLKQARESAFEALRRSNLTVHSFDPSGLETSPLMSNGFAAARLAMMNRQDNLRVLPDFTGGRAIVNTNGPEDQVVRVFAETQSYYLLGFEPAPSASDQERALRSIEVKVNVPKARVSARRSYQAESAIPATAATARERALEAALGRLLPAAPVPMDLHLASFATSDGRSLVTISADVSALSPADGRATVVTGPLDLAAGAYDYRGRAIVSSRQHLRLAWPPHDREGSGSRIDALSALEVQPGTYEIRVAAVGSDPGRAASVFTHFTVPDYARAPLALSHIIVGAGPAASTIPPDFFSSVLPVVPTARRALSRTGDTVAFAQIYQGTERTESLQRVTARVQILDQTKAAVRTQSVSFEPDLFGDNRTADARLTLPTQNLAPGEYLLRLDATMGDETATRAVRFSVR